MISEGSNPQMSARILGIGVGKSNCIFFATLCFLIVFALSSLAGDDICVTARAASTHTFRLASDPRDLASDAADLVCGAAPGGLRYGGIHLASFRTAAPARR